MENYWFNLNTNVEFVEYFDNDKNLELGEKGIIKDVKNSPLGLMFLVKFNSNEQFLYNFQIKKVE